jgi:alginate O-acetyltransferase complex protein AlgI
MDLLSPAYAAFVICVLVVYYCGPARYRPGVLALASVGLFAALSYVSATLLLLASVLVFIVAVRMERSSRNVIRQSLLAVVIGALCSYLIAIKLLALPVVSHSILRRAIVPLGVSYYTFKLIGYALDVFWGKYPAWRNPLAFLSVISFFPQLPAGPIQRVDEFTIVAEGKDAASLIRSGLRRILIGYVKKVAIADPLGAIVGFIAAHQPEYAGVLWLMSYASVLQLYADFSALTDLAVGTAALFGVRSPENFDFPFFASSISQYWRRWHMSLTRWLTDYVFLPLRMATRNLGQWGLALSIVVNMALIGLWHGLTVWFLVFGLIHGAFLVADALSGPARRRFYKSHPAADQLMTLLGPLFVFQMVTAAGIFFFGSTLNPFYTLTHFASGLTHPVDNILKLWYGFGRVRFACAAFGLLIFAIIECGGYLAANTKWAIPNFTLWPAPLRWAGYYALIAIALLLRQQSTQFIYVQF